MSGDMWIRVEKRTRREPCPICGHWGWCMVHRDGNAVICPRTPDGCACDLGEAGYLHIIGEEPKYRFAIPRMTKALERPVVAEVERSDWVEVCRQYAANCDEKMRATHAEHLGVSDLSLARLGIGNTGKGAWTFPMRDECGTVCGIRIRSDSGKKWAHVGSSNGLFIPSGLDRKENEYLFICEGPTDTAALLTLGLKAVGRASCSSGVDLLVKFVRRHAWRDVVIMSDNDSNEVGVDGARKLADALWGTVLSLTILIPPDYKDVRDWVRAGLTSDALYDKIRWSIAYNPERWPAAMGLQIASDGHAPKSCETARSVEPRTVGTGGGWRGVKVARQ